MIKTKIVALALALTGLASCEMVDPSNLFDQDNYKLGIGRPSNTQSFASYPQPDGTSFVIKVGMKIRWGGAKSTKPMRPEKRRLKQPHGLDRDSPDAFTRLPTMAAQRAYQHDSGPKLVR